LKVVHARASNGATMEIGLSASSGTRILGLDAP